MVGVFGSLDLFLFYVFFEAMLIPVYFLIGMFGGPQRQYAAVKFLLYSLFGGLLMLAALVGLYIVSGQGGHAGTFDFRALTDLHDQQRHPEGAVPRVLRRVRHQGADVAGAHLAARRRGRVDPGHGRAPRRPCSTRSAPSG